MLRARIEEQSRAAEAARKKADDDATYAYQAKVNTEEHAKATALFKGQAEADANTIASSKKSLDELVATVSLNKATVDTEAKAIGDRRREVDEATQQLISAATAGAARLTEIEKSKAGAEASLTATNEALAGATKAQASAEKAEKAVADAMAISTTTLGSITDNLEASTLSSSQIRDLLAKAEAAEKELGTVLEHLAKSDHIAIKHEERVAELSDKLKELNDRAESLLPGATSAGLASAFNKQKDRFAVPQKRWLLTFITCIVGLIVVSLPSFFTTVFGVPFFGHEPDKTWDGVLRGLTVRLPIVIPLVWLAIYAGRNYMLSLRLEEDYAYKEAISTAFEGYKREMESIVAKDPTSPTPLTTLCVNVLTALADRPGRIYEGKHQDITPLNEARGAIERAADLAKKQIAAK